MASPLPRSTTTPSIPSAISTTSPTSRASCRIFVSASRIHSASAATTRRSSFVASRTDVLCALGRVVVRGDTYRPAMRVVDVGGRMVEIHVRHSKRVHGHRIVVHHGLPPELVVRPRATDAEIDEAIAGYLPWLRRQLARAAEPVLGLERLTLTEEQGRREARARIELIAQSEAIALGASYSRITLRNQRSRWGSCSAKGEL